MTLPSYISRTPVPEPTPVTDAVKLPEEFETAVDMSFSVGREAYTKPYKETTEERQEALDQRVPRRPPETVDELRNANRFHLFNSNRGVSAKFFADRKTLIDIRKLQSTNTHTYDAKNHEAHMRLRADVADAIRTPGGADFNPNNVPGWRTALYGENKPYTPESDGLVAKPGIKAANADIDACTFPRGGVKPETYFHVTPADPTRQRRCPTKE